MLPEQYVMFKIDRTLRREFDRQDRHEFTVEMISDTGELLVLRECREQSRAIHLGLLADKIQARPASLAPCRPHCRAHHTLSPANSPKDFIDRLCPLALVWLRGKDNLAAARALLPFARFRANFSTFISRLDFQVTLIVGTRK